MATSKKEQKAAKRKAKQKKKKNIKSNSIAKEKASILFMESQWSYQDGEYAQALALLDQALRLRPDNVDMLKMQAQLGLQLKRNPVVLKALRKLHALDALPADLLFHLGNLLSENECYQEAIAICNEALEWLPKLKMPDKPEIRRHINQQIKYCEYQIRLQEIRKKSPSPTKAEKTNVQPATHQKARSSTPAPTHAPAPQRDKGITTELVKEEITVAINIDARSFQSVLCETPFTTPEAYDLALAGYRLQYRESFENLITPTLLTTIRSFWYQEETARKVLKTFRGRAMLADEVGLGKTIEALIVLHEYIHRGMIKNALILTPTPLVSQWGEELQAKFGLSFTSTNDSEYRTGKPAFWQKPFLLASINIAKTKANFSLVTEREWDMVIVDEAHHLKNRNTQNWKLVNTLKKRFLLLLTATPVENNLMELFNLITLLKPGQLKTAAAFKKEFMTSGDPTDPRNREKLKELLGQVMIRNTRAVAKLDIPPRFAQTMRVEPNKAEKELYERIDMLVKSLNKQEGNSSKLLLKNLLAEAGSSPRAVSQTITNIISRRELFSEHEEMARAISNLCKSMGDSGKNLMLGKLLEKTKDKTIIFVKFKETLHAVSEYLEWNNFPHALFHGGLNNPEKDEQIRLFKDERNILLTTEVGGEGRNLQFCHQMINYDLPWNPMKIEQRIGRIHRIGQEHEVMIYNFCGVGSIEEYILDILDRKINMFELVIGEIDMILGRIKGEQEFSEMVYEIWMNAETKEEKDTQFGGLAAKLKRSQTSYQKTKALDEKLFGENYEL